MNKELLSLICNILALIINFLVVKQVIPWLKKKTDSYNWEALRMFAESAVRSAEQIFSQEEYKKKKAYAMEYVAGKATEMGIVMKAEDIDALVESFVNLVKYGTDYHKGEE